MNERDRLIISEFKKRLIARLEKHIKRLIVFGSKARGESREDSDIDIVVLIDNKTPEMEKSLEDIAYQVMWDYDFKPIISLKVFAESDYNNALKKGFSFYQHVEKEGVLV